MGLIADLVETSKRYELWKQRQVARATAPTEKPSAEMRRARLEFSNTKLWAPDPAVFFESVIEENDLQPIRYFKLGELASRPIGRIHIDLGPKVGQGYATGFLAAPGLLLTNQHVLQTADFARSATVTFDAEDDIRGLPKVPRVFELDPQRLYLADPKLDYCIVAVNDRATDGTAVSTFGYLRLFGRKGKILREDNATIAGHPRGRQKQVAVRNNKIIVYVYDQELEGQKQELDENNHLYYTTDTLAGSSGSPVLSDQWFVVALHRRGVPATRGRGAEVEVLRKDNTRAREGDPPEMIRYKANEGVRVSRILDSLGSIAASERPEAAQAKRALTAIIAAARDPRDGPFWVPVAPPVASSAPAIGSGVEELVRRDAGVFAGARGYQVGFLGGELRMPELNPELKAAVAYRIDDPRTYVLDFCHFSTAVHARRRMPIFAAVNIDGAKYAEGGMPGRPNWSYDPRLDEAQQPDDSIFSTMLQRGHMAAREFVYWGDEAPQADIHSFTLSNVCPQIGRFNGNKEWAQLERRIVAAAKGKRQKVSVFMGPVFSDDDPAYDDLRSDRSDAAFGTGIRLPRRFWYVVAWNDGQRIRARAFVLDQSDDIDAAGPLELDFETPATVAEVRVSEVERLTGLTFPGLA